MLAGAALALASTGAFAQSTQLTPAQQALAAGLADAVRQNDNEFIAQEVFDNAGGRGGAARSATTTGGLIVGSFATGRLRGSEHSGLIIKPLENTGVADDGTRRTFAFKVFEGSALANIVITAPGQIMGGTVKYSAFAGHNWLSLELKPNAENPAMPGTIGSAENESFIVGGSWLWAGQGTYLVASAVGTWGETSLVDKVGDFPNINHYSFDTIGFVGTLTAGRTIPLAAGPAGPMLDLRGAVGYTFNEADPFLNVFGNEFRSNLSAWNATASATVFTNIVQNDAVFRPFVQAYVRHELDYDQKLKFSDTPGGEPHTLTAYQQHHTYGGADAGFTYTLRNMTFGASVYYEQSGTERTLGGRVRASWQLN
ncbi:MAG TPA: hypothetical protein VH765_10340 [Xanthobacteraceae bacterium]